MRILAAQHVEQDGVERRFFEGRFGILRPRTVDPATQRQVAAQTELTRS